jgi:hypothetical protein
MFRLLSPVGTTRLPQSGENVQLGFATNGLPTQLIPIAFRRENQTFLYLYPRDK